MEEPSLSENTILVTGAGSGFGVATIPALVEAGAKLIVSGRSEERLNDLSKLSDQIQVYVTDLDERGVKDLLRFAMTVTDKLDGIVHFAGEWVPGLVHETKDCDWERSFEANFNVARRVVSAALPKMMEARSGSIVLISTILVRQPVPQSAPYVCAKAALTNLAKCLALDYAKYGIRTNCISPGLSNTPMTKNVFEQDEWVAELVKSYPIGRLGRADDLAGIVELLLSKRSSWINGAIIPIDGGYHLSSEIP